jgi:hypothetical protein
MTSEAQRPLANGEPNPLTALGGQWAVRLTTFRRDGTPVSTPVNVAVAGDRVVFRTTRSTRSSSAFLIRTAHKVRRYGTRHFELLPAEASAR